MVDAARRRRDPEARRRAIVGAAAELIVEVGVDAITHRMVAARADVPLGATTQYFDTLDDLRAAALKTLVAQIDEQMAEVRAVVAEHGATPAVLARIVHDGLADAKSAEADRAVVTAAISDPQLRALARRWSSQLAGFFEAEHGDDRALAAAVFINGTIWQAHLDDAPLPARTIELALAGILGDPHPQTDSTTD
ncbi:TetR family transcriptional regulator [Microbacterium sp.]|uniref:TetR/AcrR family transcriptional regulator n=1 Tax=Microbacterium sp. TaxID=51671 RepID=UPI0033404323